MLTDIALRSHPAEGFDQTLVLPVFEHRA